VKKPSDSNAVKKLQSSPRYDVDKAVTPAHAGVHGSVELKTQIRVIDIVEIRLSRPWISRRAPG
jgi:hypothetical protein